MDQSIIAGAERWDDMPSDILSDIADAKESIRKETGKRRGAEQKVILCHDRDKYTLENFVVCMWCGGIIK